MDAQTTLTLRCTACGQLTEAKCSCGASYAYISPGELAAKAVKDSPGKSDRAIAEELGVSDRTVNRARASTATNDAVGKRTGRDGKARRPRGRPPKAPGVKQAQRSIDLHPEVWKMVKARATTAGVSVAELIGQLLTATIDPNVDPKTLPKTAQEKLAAALRQQQRKERSDFERLVQGEVTKRMVTANAAAQKQANEGYEREKMYREFLAKQKRIMTAAEFTLVCSLLHPDSRASASEERLRRAFQMFEPKKFALTGEK